MANYRREVLWIRISNNFSLRTAVSCEESSVLMKGCWFDNLIEHLRYRSSEALRVLIPAEVPLTPLSASRHTREVAAPRSNDAKIRAFIDGLPSDNASAIRSMAMVAGETRRACANLRFFPADFRVPDPTVWHSRGCCRRVCCRTIIARFYRSSGPVSRLSRAARSVRISGLGSAISHADVPRWYRLRGIWSNGNGFPVVTWDALMICGCLMSVICGTFRSEDDARKAPTVPNRSFRLVNAK